MTNSLHLVLYLPIGALITSENEATLRFRPPAPGTYTVTIFARRQDSRERQTKAASFETGSEGENKKTYKSVVEYRIVSLVKENKVLFTISNVYYRTTYGMYEYLYLYS